MIGYKGVILYHGILKSKYKQTFQLGIATPKLSVDDGVAFSEAGYSFCGTMEEVLCHLNYLNVATSNVMQDIRLFEIETSGQILGGSYHYKAESITLKREIVATEIMEYFTTHRFEGEIGKVVSEYLPKDPTKWDYETCKSCLGYAWLGNPGSYEDDYNCLYEKIKWK